MEGLRTKTGTFVVGHAVPSEWREKVAAKHRGKPAKWITSDKREEIGKRISRAKRGVKRSVESRKRMSIARMRISPWNKGLKGFRAGSIHHNWRGGITPINQQIRTSFEYRAWREAVFRRDDYRCVSCGERGGRLNADHIKPFAIYTELRLVIGNGRTLCENCHRATETYAGKGLKRNLTQQKHATSKEN